MASISQESLLLIPSERFPLTRQRAAEYLLSEERPGRSGERSSRQTANYKANQKETYKIGLENKGVCVGRGDFLPGYSRGNRISRPKLARVGNSREIDNSGVGICPRRLGVDRSWGVSPTGDHLGFSLLGRF